MSNKIPDIRFQINIYIGTIKKYIKMYISFETLKKHHIVFTKYLSYELNVLHYKNNILSFVGMYCSCQYIQSIPCLYLITKLYLIAIM